MSRVAAIYWPTSSVGGINTELVNLRRAAKRVGDDFFVLRSGDHSRIRPGLFPKRKLIRGGDTFIYIDGEASHHPNQIQDTLSFIHSEFDRVYFAFLCPHPTKAYNEPRFLPMYSECILPCTARVTDGYWKAYEDWGEKCLPYCDAITVSQPAFAGHFSHPKVKASRFPFRPVKATEKRSEKPLTVWTSQWKAIKGIQHLLPHLHRLNHQVELYSNGILYYQLRSTRDWQDNIGADHFAGFNGEGRAEFFGYVELKEIPNILSRAWFMIDLMGSGKPRNHVYTQGSFNNTTVEAAYYGCCPVLHSQARAVVPSTIALFVDNADEIPGLLNSRKARDFAVDPRRVKRAKQWVKENFDAVKIYREAVRGEI